MRKKGDLESKSSTRPALGTLSAAVAAVVAIGSAACGPAPRAEAPATERRAEPAWDAMSADEKLEHMRAVVKPRMSAVFAEFDPHRYPKLSCSTCHGSDGAKRAWKMPNPDLLLEPTAWNTGRADPESAPSQLDAFMAKSVAPEMATLLGRPTFGCFGCHTAER